jgi:hypothetical protein
MEETHPVRHLPRQLQPRPARNRLVGCKGADANTADATADATAITVVIAIAVVIAAAFPCLGPRGAITIITRTTRTTRTTHTTHTTRKAAVLDTLLPPFLEERIDKRA